MGSDYYQTLEVTGNADKEEIKKSFRRLSKKYHPDTNPGDQKAAGRIREITEAYEVLSNPEKRKQYDEERQKVKAAYQSKNTGTKKTAAPFAAGVDFNNLSGSFESFFGFHPKDQKVDEEKLGKQKKRANPMDTTDLFERYMGIKNKK